MQRIYPTLRIVVAGLCLYETATILTHGWTLSRLSKKHPWIAPVILVGLGVHLLEAVLVKEVP